MTGGDPDNPRSRAACLGAPAEYWFPDFVHVVLDDDGEVVEEIEFLDDGTQWELYGDTSYAYEIGREICNGCPIREECLEGAMERRERYGMWGGLIPIERRRIERRNRRRNLHERRQAEADAQAAQSADTVEVES